jgi:hypothetical protein
MGRFVIVAYVPKPGKGEALLAVSDKPGYVMKAADGTIVEVFEWRDAGAIKAAHESPAVLALWAEFGAACDFTPLAKLHEAQQMFAEFDAVTL